MQLMDPIELSYFLMIVCSLGLELEGCGAIEDLAKYWRRAFVAALMPKA